MREHRALLPDKSARFLYEGSTLEAAPLHGASAVVRCLRAPGGAYPVRAVVRRLFFRDAAMTRPTRTVANPLQDFPPLPLKAAHWQAVVQALRLSPQQAKIVELALRGMCDKQIALAMSLSEPTIRTYLQRIFVRTGTHGRMGLALRVLAVSHQVDHEPACHRTG